MIGVYAFNGRTLFSLGLEDIKSYLIWIQIVERDYIDGLRDSHFLMIFIQIVI